jgi:hypothetical protein
MELICERGDNNKVNTILYPAAVKQPTRKNPQEDRNSKVPVRLSVNFRLTVRKGGELEGVMAAVASSTVVRW